MSKNPTTKDLLVILIDKIDMLATNISTQSDSKIENEVVNTVAEDVSKASSMTDELVKAGCEQISFRFSKANNPCIKWIPNEQWVVMKNIVRAHKGFVTESGIMGFKGNVPASFTKELSESGIKVIAP